MASGLVALLDDVAGIAKLAAASLDDVAGAAGKAGAKAAGVVIDDTAVTPRYVTGFSPERELPIIGKIALGSLRNKLLFLLPGALLLSAVAPWALTPLLMAGGAFLCFEGAEKVIDTWIGGGGHGDDGPADADPAEIERQKVAGAIRTDLILSAEIMAIALAEVASQPLAMRALALVLVSLAITAGVYGVVALIVKMDDVGLHLARRGSALARALGRGLVKGMPVLMAALGVIGTAAMIWVGGGIVLHGLEQYGLGGPAHAIHTVAAAIADTAPAAHGFIEWAVTATGSGLAGLALGAVIAIAVHKLRPH
jgi:predicted DNA repair protein MutK